MRVAPSLLSRLSLLLAIAVSLDCAAEAAASSLVRIELTGLAQASGNVYIAVYNSPDDWLGDDTVLQRKVVIADALDGEVVRTELELPAGEYAFSIFYDVNNNGKLDTNFIGIPKEPLALSNNAIGKYGPPKYSDAVFKLGTETEVQRLEIEAL